MKQRGWPLWLLRDVRAFMAVMLSFWTLMIFTITGERTAMRKGRLTRSFLDRHAMHLANAEAWLDWAFWRQAHRRLGLDPRAVRPCAIPPPTTSADTLARSQSYIRAFRNMQLVVDSYVEALRQHYRINARDLAARGSTRAALCSATHHERVGAAVRLSSRSRFAFIPGSPHGARLSQDTRGSAHARGPPPRNPCPVLVPSRPGASRVRERARMSVYERYRTPPHFRLRHRSHATFAIHSGWNRQFRHCVCFVEDAVSRLADHHIHSVRTGSMALARRSLRRL